MLFRLFIVLSAKIPGMQMYDNLITANSPAKRFHLKSLSLLLTYKIRHCILYQKHIAEYENNEVWLPIYTTFSNSWQ